MIWRSDYREPYYTYYSLVRGFGRIHVAIYPSIPVDWMSEIIPYTLIDVENICYIALHIAWETTFMYDFCLVHIYGFPALSQLTISQFQISIFTLLGFNR